MKKSRVVMVMMKERLKREDEKRFIVLHVKCCRSGIA